MRIIVLVKEVPDTYSERTLNRITGLLERPAGDNVIDEISDRALEVALEYRRTHQDAHITVMTMGPESASGILRKCLARGADDAVHIKDDQLIGADIRLTAEVLAAAIQQHGFDLVVAGNESYDGAGGVLPVMISEILGIPALSHLHEVTISPDAICGLSARNDLVVKLETFYPALISITERLPEPGLADFKGIVAAKKKPMNTLGLQDLGVTGDDIVQTPRTILLAVESGPERPPGRVVTDQGDGAEKILDFLNEKNLLGRS